MFANKEEVKVICLTAVRNEAWILRRFLKCASLWADHIIIADQLSEDGSREIAKQYSKVTLIDNKSPELNEGKANQLLLDAARKIPGRRLFICLDADEVLSANFMLSKEWVKVMELKEGIVIEFEWLFLLPGLASCWAPRYMKRGFMDDGSEYKGREIHSLKFPYSGGEDLYQLKEIKILHYHYLDTKRMESKRHWYQCWGILNFPRVSATQIYRFHHENDAIPQEEIRPILNEWFEGYEKRDIDMRAVNYQDHFWWDKDILRWFQKFGTKKFRKAYIWDQDWYLLATKLGINITRAECRDPRNIIEKLIHLWFKKSQPYSIRKARMDVRVIQKILRLLGW